MEKNIFAVRKKKNVCWKRKIWNIQCKKIDKKKKINPFLKKSDIEKSRLKKNNCHEVVQNRRLEKVLPQISRLERSQEIKTYFYVWFQTALATILLKMSLFVFKWWEECDTLEVPKDLQYAKITWITRDTDLILRLIEQILLDATSLSSSTIRQSSISRFWRSRAEEFVRYGYSFSVQCRKASIQSVAVSLFRDALRFCPDSAVLRFLVVESYSGPRRIRVWKGCQRIVENSSWMIVSELK